MQNPANLQVYHRALDLAARVHRVTRLIPSSTSPGLASQIARASASISANIAEGVGHPNPGRCPFHLGVAIASAFEVEAHLRLAQKLGYRIADLAELLDELEQVRRMLYALRAYREKRLRKG